MRLAMMNAKQNPVTSTPGALIQTTASPALVIPVSPETDMEVAVMGAAMATVTAPAMGARISMNVLRQVPTPVQEIGFA